MVLVSRGRVVVALVGALLSTACAAPVTGVPTAVRRVDFTPSEADPDPTEDIEGVLRIDYAHGIQHVDAPRRVDYDNLPPLGGAHDSHWAPCNGVVFPVAVRTEHFVHSLEHGAVWLTYDPERVQGADLAALVARVEGKPYTVLSPFPGQAKAVSVQSWGRQLQVEAVDDERIDQFVTATRGNRFLAPEPGARCDSVGQDYFDESDPPPFQAGPPGPDAVPETGG
ncbi:DUF3105 domain-containing protein [Actinokineospora sp. 24-640]